MLDVYLYEQLIGHAYRLEGMQYQFKYESDCKHPLSCALPISDAPFNAEQSRAFFRGLLPEETRRERYARRLKIETDDDYALLSAIGGDCAGAVQIMGDVPTQPLTDITYTASDLTNFCDQLRTGVLISKDNRLSLTGAQLKEAVIVDDDNNVCIPRDGRPSSHIVKVPPQPGTNTGYDDIVYNEFFCLRLAQRVSDNTRLSFSVADARLLPFTYYRGGPEEHILCITRFDRTHREDGNVERIHQEDFCQASSKIQRYASSGGPTFSTLAEICNTHCKVPGLERLKIFHAAVFNVIIGNCDAHGRNFWLAHPKGEAPRLAPLYDLVSTAIYPDLGTDMAMPAGDDFELSRMDKRALANIAKDLFLAPSSASAEVKHVAQTVLKTCDGVRGEISRESTFLDRLLEEVKSRASCLL